MFCFRATLVLGSSVRHQCQTNSAIMNLNAQSNRARLELLPGYPNFFDVMFDSVKIEGSPVEAKEDSDEMDSDFSVDEEEENGIGYDEYLSFNLPTNH